MLPPIPYGTETNQMEFPLAMNLNPSTLHLVIRDIVDSLAKHNSVEFTREGGRVTVAVPEEVRLKVEVELGDDNEIEIELTW